MSLNALLHIRYAQQVSGTSVPIIWSSRLYVCYCRLWCAVLDCWLSGVRCKQQSMRPGRGMLHDDISATWPQRGYVGGTLLLRYYDLYQRLQLQFYVLLTMGAMDARNM